MTAIRVQIRTAAAQVVLSQEGGYTDPAGLFRVALFADGVDLGNADQRTVTVPWRGADGDRLEVTGYGNRTQQYEAKVTSLTGDAAGLDAGERYLAQVVGQPAELWWTPPGGGENATTVYDVETSRLDFKLQDSGEIAVHPRRVFTFQVTAQPFGRRTTETVVPAVGAGTGTTTVVPTPVSIWTDAAGFAGWTAFFNRPEVGDSPSLGVQSAGGVGIRNATVLPVGYAGWMVLTKPIALGTNRWLRVRWTSWPQAQPPFIGGTTPTGAVYLVPTATLGDSTYYYLPAGTPTLTSLAWLIPQGGQLAIIDVAHQNAMPYSTTACQLQRTFHVAGTARTPISVEVSHTASLGEVIAYLRPEDGTGNRPPIRDFRTSSVAPVTPDTAAYNGNRVDVSAGQTETYDIPAGSMPESTYAVLVRHRPTSNAGMTWTVNVSTVVGSVTTLGQQTLGPMYRDGTAAAAYTTTDLGLVTLPTVRIPRENAAVPSTAKVRLTVTPSIATGIDEIWLFDIRRGRLIRVNCGSGAAAAGGASNRLFIDAPSVLSPRTLVFGGTTATRSNARHIAQTDIASLQDLVAEPGMNTLFTACGRNNAAVLVRYFERGLHHVGAPQ